MSRSAAVLFVILLSTGAAFPWGLLAHRIVTEAACGRMPPDVAPYYLGISGRVQELSLEPDTVLRARDTAGEEARRHFINLDAYEPWPFAGIPREYDDAKSRFGESRVKKNGLLPWRIGNVLRDLVASMRRKDPQGIALQSGYLSHYVADSYQPLHLTLNHDGQGSCNLGIHHAFEAEMIERQAQRYRGAVMRARGSVAAIQHPVNAVFNRMRDDYPLAARIMEADTSALHGLKNEGKDYWEELDRLAGPIAERQMSAAATAVASLWYTAWLDAGRPRLAAP